MPIPEDVMRRRLGWSFAATKEEIGSLVFRDTIQQVGSIRKKEATARLKLYAKEAAEAAAPSSVAGSGRPASAATDEVGD